MAQADIRQYKAQAESTQVFGRVLCGARNHHFVIDGPEQNGCPGEEVTPAEVFLAGVASCGVELVQVLAKSTAPWIVPSPSVLRLRCSIPCVSASGCEASTIRRPRSSSRNSRAGDRST